MSEGDAATLKHNRKLTVCLTAIFLNNSLFFMLKDHVNQATSPGKESNSNVALR